MITDDTVDRAVLALERLVAENAANTVAVCKCSSCARFAAVIAVARAAVVHSRVMVERHPELSDPANAEIPTVGTMLAAVARLAEYAPNGAPNPETEARR